MRPIRALALTTVGIVGAVAAAAAVAKRTLPSHGGEESDELGLVAIFDGIELESRATAFAGGSVLVWFGGVSLDLRKATLAPGAHLSVKTILGGIAVRVPPDWRLESTVRGFAGGVDVRQGSESPDAPTLTIDGLALCGGISVAARRPDADDGESPDT